jgi:hypothetical protein
MKYCTHFFYANTWLFCKYVFEKISMRTKPEYEKIDDEIFLPQTMIR